MWKPSDYLVNEWMNEWMNELMLFWSLYQN